MYSTLPRLSELDPQYQTHFSVIARIAQRIVSPAHWAVSFWIYSGEAALISVHAPQFTRFSPFLNNKHLHTSEITAIHRITMPTRVNYQLT